MAKSTKPEKASKPAKGSVKSKPGRASTNGKSALADATITDARIGLNNHNMGRPWCYFVIEGTNLRRGGAPVRTKVVVRHNPTGDVFEGYVHILITGDTVAVARVRWERRGRPRTTTSDLSITVQNPPQPVPSPPHDDDGDVYTYP